MPPFGKGPVYNLAWSSGDDSKDEWGTELRISKGRWHVHRSSRNKGIRLLRRTKYQMTAGPIEVCLI